MYLFPINTEKYHQTLASSSYLVKTQYCAILLAKP